MLLKLLKMNYVINFKERIFFLKATKLKRDEVISWFTDKQSYYNYYKKQIDEKMFFELENLYLNL
jgi:hypothetical protein